MMLDKSVQYQYTRIAEMTPCHDCNFYGRVVRLKGPFKSRGSDHCIALAVIDSSLPPLSEVRESNALPVSCFHKDEAKLPSVLRVGEVVQFRHFKIQPYNDTLQALSTRHSSHTVYYKDGNDDWRTRPDRPLSEHELQKLNEMIVTQHTTSASSSSTTAVQCMQICDLKSRMKFDLVAQVHMLVSERPNMVSVAVTDYTENECLEFESDDLPKYMRKRIMLVNFWDNFADTARTLRQGDFVRVKGLRCETVDRRIVAVLHGDATLADCVCKLGDDDAQAGRLRTQARLLEGLQRVSERIGVIDRTAVLRPSIAITSIERVLLSPDPCGVFAVKARVRRMLPIRPHSHFMFEMVLQDASGRLPVIVYGDDGVRFLACSAESFNAERKQALESLLLAELPSPFLVKAYTVRGRRKYRLFDTVLL